ncbi:MAG: DHA2 family efflux MFS transporter permease subunit [Caulobacteraceae bacterium]
MTTAAPEDHGVPEALADGLVAARHARILPLIIGSALFMQTLDATIIANALPSMAKSLGETPLTLNLAITGYLLTAAVFLPISGWAADRFGARTVFRAAIILFAVSSLFCGMSQTLWELVAARMVQGVAGAMMMPVGRLVLLRTVPKAELVRALALLTMPALLGPVLGPPLGGFIVTFGSWRWIFYINVPLGILGVVLATLYIPNIKEAVSQRLDLRGFVLTGAGLAAVVFGFENIGRDALPPAAVTGLFVIGGLCLLAYVLHARRTPDAILDLSVLRIQTFRASTVGGIFSRLSIGAGPFLTALLLQLGFGLNAFQAGMISFAGAAGAMTMKTTARPILARFGFKRVLVTNTVVSAICIAACALFRPSTPYVVMMFILLLGGFFRSLQFTALNALAYADVPQPSMSRASSLAAMLQQLSQSIGVGLAAILLHATLRYHHTTELTAETIAPAFAVVGALSLLALLFFSRLPANAGAEVSGRREPVSVS